MARRSLTLTVAEAQSRVLALAPKLPSERVPLVAAAGRWAIRDIVARRTQPAADLSAMDGFALRFAELPGPWRITGESAAGTAPGQPLAPGEAVRIFTGAPLPAGADTILIQEDARWDDCTLHLAGAGPAQSGAYVRAAGADFAAGDRLVAAGDPLTPARIALAAMGGHGFLPVARRLRVASLSTGNELVAPGESPEGLPASNAPMLAAMLARLPVEFNDCGIIRDDLDALTAALRAAAARADIVVTTGGASVGDHDLVRPALEAAGVTLDFWRVAMKPGKPLVAGRLGNATVLGLPGNPVSAYVTAWLFLVPLIRHAMGAADPLPPVRTSPLVAPLTAGGNRAEYVRARRERDGVRPLHEQDSAMLRALADADTLIVRAPHQPSAEAGEMVEIMDIA